MPWTKVFDNVWLPLKLAGMRRDEAAPVVAAGAGAGGPLALRRRVPARALGRHEDARVDRARAGHAPAPAADGRALRRAGRNDAHQAQQRPAGHLARAPLLDRVRHAQRVRVGVPVEPHRGDGGAAGPRDRRDRASTSPIRAAKNSAPRAATTRIARRCPNPCTERCMASTSTIEPVIPSTDRRPRRRRGCARTKTSCAGANRCCASPCRCCIVAGAAAGWEWMVRANNIPHYILPAPSLIAAHAVRQLGFADERAVVHREAHAACAARGHRRRRAAGDCCSRCSSGWRSACSRSR
jgi:hypothetical protein